MLLNHSATNLIDVFALPKDKALQTFYDRMITFPITAITALKEELDTTVGKDRSKGIFIRYGYHTGVSDGEKTLTFQWEDEVELINTGPKLHKLHGYLDEVIVDAIEYDKKGDLELIKSLWINSYEAIEFIKGGSLSDQPVCHSLCGYASGYLSTVLKRPMLVVENKCMAMGHDQCEVTIKPMEKWGDELENEYRYYQSSSMIQELDEITAKLKIERDYLSKGNQVHRKLIEGLLSKQGIQRIVDILYKTTGLPTFIENEFNQILVKSDQVTIDFDLKKLKTNSTNLLMLHQVVEFLGHR